MGKELTPLEALNELRNNYVPVFHSRRMGKQQVVKSFAIIETKLKDYEKLEESLGFDPTIFKQDFETLMNKHKALERVKELCLEHDIHDTAELDNTLIAFEILKKDFESLRNFKYKQLDALEIIKEKEWFDDFMKEHLTREWFTKDELDLLKEVFL